MHDGPGIRTTVFFKGCPLKCLWCSNPDSQKQKPEISYSINKCILCKKCIDVCENNVISENDNHIVLQRKNCIMCGKCVQVCPGRAIHYCGKIISNEDVIEEVLQDMTCYYNSGGGMTLSGGEVTMQKNFAISLLSEAKKKGIHTAIETSAFTTYENFSEIIKYVDHLIIDLKHANPVKHKQITGVDNALIIENITKTQKEHSNVNIRIPVIPTINDSKEELAQMATILNQLDGIKSIELLQYHEFGATKYAQIGMEYPLKGIQKYDLNHLTDLVQFFRAKCPKKNVICQAS